MVCVCVSYIDIDIYVHNIYILVAWNGLCSCSITVPV